MIAYEELCDALGRWRGKNGLPSTPSARPTRVSGGTAAVPPPPMPAAFVQSSTEELDADELDADAEPLAELAAGGEDDATGTAVAITDSRPKREDSTSEIDIDGLDVVEENDV